MVIRRTFDKPKATLQELFSRIVFSVCIGNTDDHARNHAAFWDGTQLTLTPAYDLCPQPRSGGETEQATAIGRDGSKVSRLQTCIDAAAEYGLSRGEATEVVDMQIAVVTDGWNDAADKANLTHLERKQLWHRQILNPSIFYR